MSECAVYRMYDEADNLLWVGMSINVIRRLADHRDKAWWPEVTRVAVGHFASKAEAAAAEAEAIRQENPRHNTRAGLYPWPQWMDGGAWRIVRGEDFLIPVESMAQMVRIQGRRWSRPARAYVDGDSVEFQFSREIEAAA